MSKSESLLLYQYPDPASWENYGQFWNDVSASSVSTAVQDPACGLDFYDTGFLWNLGVTTNQNHQEGQFASAAVTIPDVEETGAYSIVDTAFQTTWQSSGYSHPSFDFEAPGDYTGPVIGQTAATAGPDDANNEVIGEFQSASQSNWSSATSYRLYILNLAAICLRRPGRRPTTLPPVKSPSKNRRRCARARVEFRD